MFILIDKRNNQMFFGKKPPMLIVCQDHLAAEQAIREIHQRTGIILEYAQIDLTKSKGWWFLSRRNGKTHQDVPGVAFVFKSKSDAWDYSGVVFNKTGKIVIPTPT
jgi:hypothetical protein